MIKKNNLKYAMLAIGALMLVGCQSKPAQQDVAQPTLGTANTLASNNAGQTQAYGLNRPIAALAPQTNSQGFIQNPMRAPSSQTYYFAFNQSQLRPNDLKALMVQANYLASHPSAQVRLEGNTDNRGSREYNIALGWRRDQSVGRILEQQGVQPTQIQMISYGKERPAVQGNSEQAWSLNRRVNLVYKVTG